MKHKHHEIIEAKAKDMDLVLLVKSNGVWRESALHFPKCESDICFLCHPKHVDQTIHWLSGGEVIFEYYGDEFIEIREDGDQWSPHLWCMQGEHESRIKPKKEKRWIVVDGAHITDGNYCSSAFPSLKRAKDKMMALNAIEKDMKLKLQIIEIEIEVN